MIVGMRADADVREGNESARLVQGGEPITMTPPSLSWHSDGRVREMGKHQCYHHPGRRLS